jgi:response regulator RpfG family c-di-GMP phosphodiesterase
MVTDFIDSVLIIDDKEDEIKDLQQVLEEEDIFVQFLNPTDKKLSDLPVLKKHKQVVFIDLSLDDSINILNNVSTKIRPLLSKILPKTKGCYGLVVWSKHTEDVNILFTIVSPSLFAYSGGTAFPINFAAVAILFVLKT